MTDAGCHIIGPQPEKESCDVFWRFWTFSVEIVQGMSKEICKHCKTGKEKGRKKQASQNPPSIKSYLAKV